MWLSEIASIAFPRQSCWCPGCLTGTSQSCYVRSCRSRLSRFAPSGAGVAHFLAFHQSCGFVSSRSSLIDWWQTGLSLPAEALAFLHRLPVSVSLLQIALMSFRRFQERICGLSIPVVAGRHNHRRPAAVRPLEIALIAFRLLASSGGGVSVP